VSSSPFNLSSSVYLLICENSPKNAKELFNLRHSSLRNAVERVFGVVKRRFRIFRDVSTFPPQTQARIILACCIMHNFIRRQSPEDDDLLLGAHQDLETALRGLETIMEGEDIEDNGDMQVQFGISVAEGREADARRDQIAEAMWADYVGAS
jgi:hypothetical protein